MGCGCKKKGSEVNFSEIPGVPQNEVWGPALWTILHVFAERLGAQTAPILADQEAQEIDYFVHLLPRALPCPVCQGHMLEYVRDHPFKWNTLRGVALKNTVREWLWNFHEAVNAQRGVLSGITLAELEALYGPSAKPSVGCEADTVNAALFGALRINWIKRETRISASSHLLRLRTLLGV
jgi:hypothetical protein